MSYILDALRRADAERERERGGVPDLHATPLVVAAPSAPAADPAVPWRGLAIGGMVGALVAVAAVLGWRIIRPSEPVAALPGAAAVVAPPPAVAPSPPLPPAVVAPGAVAPAPTLAPPAPAASPVRAGQLLLPDPPPRRTAPAGALPAPSRSATVAPGQPATTPLPVEPRGSGTPLPAPALPPTSPRSAAASAAPADATSLAAAPWSALPEDLRRRLPPLQVGGSIHSDNAASRMLILDGQPYREGDRPAPDVVVEQIRLRSAVLRIGGRRYELLYQAP